MTVVDSQVVLSFTVAGVPAPQGSKVHTRFGGVREANPATRPWRTAVAAEASALMAQREPLSGPVRLDVTFVFPRPKGHFGSGRNADSLRASAPELHTVKPDVDKLLRAVADSLTGIVLRDDAQIAVVEARKVYGSPQARITITPLVPRALERTAA